MRLNQSGGDKTFTTDIFTVMIPEKKYRFGRNSLR